jgi:predicted AlkP superfamily phosphohydrolase/phosphomutase
MPGIEANDKLLIIGLDGASWDVIDPLLQGGQLPNLARLIRQGASGALRSLEPMISTMLWTSISSGKLPDKHGVRDFAISSKAVQCKRLWDILGEQGLSIGVYGHLITWPPDSVKGFMVPGTFALGPETHPPELAFLRKLAMDEASGSKRQRRLYIGYGWQALRNGVHPNTLWHLGSHLAKESLRQVDPLMAFYRKRVLKLHLDCDVFCHLCHRFEPQFTFFYTHLLDSTQHLFWKFMEPATFPDVNQGEVDRYGQVISEAYREADRAVGQILSAVGHDATVMIISDHGAQAALGSVEGSAWSIKTETLLRMLGLWGQVRAVNIGFALYLCPKREEPQIRAQITRLFEEVVAQGSGIRVFQVTPMEYSYVKIQVLEDEIQRLKGSTVKVGNMVCPFDEIVEISSGRVSGTHHHEGICILWGKQVKAGAELRGASILDVTPTALMLMGLPVARDMDGRALEEAVNDRFLQAYPVGYRETYEDRVKPAQEGSAEVAMPEELVKKLKTLGYLG